MRVFNRNQIGFKRRSRGIDSQGREPLEPARARPVNRGARALAPRDSKSQNESVVRKYLVDTTCL